MTNVREHTFELVGGRAAAKVWGEPQGLPTLALHGWLDNAASFDTLAPLLPELRLVAMDLPGHGRSQWRPPGAAYHFIDWLPDVIDVLDHLGWERCVLMGHSLGAAVASMLAGVLPERVSALVCLEGLGPLSAEPEQAPERMARHLSEYLRINRKRPHVYPDTESIAQRLHAVVPGLGLESARLLVTRGTRAVPGGVTWASDPRLRGTSPMPLTEEHVRVLLRRITCPTLLVRATQGYLADTGVMLGRRECLAQATVAKLDGGHHVHMERAVELAPIIRRFLRP